MYADHKLTELVSSLVFKLQVTAMVTSRYNRRNAHSCLHVLLAC